VTVEPRDCNDFAQALAPLSAGRAPAGVPAQRLRRFVTDRVSHGTARAVASPFMPTRLRQHLGRLGEDLALAHLERLGYTLVARNYRTRHGEIDLVVFDGTALVFVEVKTRRANSARRGPWEALHERKRLQVRRMASAFLLEVADRPYSPDVRFDAIGVLIDGQGQLVRLDHLEAAF
jgi:putative endonuclease